MTYRPVVLVVASAILCVAPKDRPPPSPPPIIPAPQRVVATGDAFTIARSTLVVVPDGTREALRVGELLANPLRGATGFPLAVTSRAGCANAICLTLREDEALGDEGYQLDVSTDGVRLMAAHPAGLFHGIETLRQLLPVTVERTTVQPGPWIVPGVHVIDRPRFAWRGAMLDVARHFFTVADVERFIDLIALYKMNVLHLHLTDDQGWRIAIDAWPGLVAAGPFYSQRDYVAIDKYAADRYVTVVPEIDVPGHSAAALAAYPELRCDGGLCPESEASYRFLDQVFAQVAALTPGPYLHIGGDEAKQLSPERYARFIERAQTIVQAHDKVMIGWQEVAKAALSPSTICQYWDTGSDPGSISAAAKAGARLILSPASHAYLDMKYGPTTRLGTNWAGYVGVRDAYMWDPSSLLLGMPVERVIGVEAPLWTESSTSLSDAEYLAFPRLPGLAEIGWSPAGPRDWDAYRVRLAVQDARWTAMGMNYYRSPDVWPRNPT